MTNDTVAFIPWTVQNLGLFRHFSSETEELSATRDARESKTTSGATFLTKPTTEFRSIRSIVVLYVLFDGVFCAMTESIPSIGGRLYVSRHRTTTGS
jgi:hypothetical protein